MYLEIKNFVYLYRLFFIFVIQLHLNIFIIF